MFYQFLKKLHHAIELIMTNLKYKNYCNIILIKTLMLKIALY